MAKLTLADGTIIEGTPQELYDISQKFGVKADEPKVAQSKITHNGIAYTLVDRKAQEGDVVILMGDSLPYWFTKGKAYKINSHGKISESDTMGYDYNVYDSHYGRTEANVLVYEPKVEPLKVGDFAVVIDDVMEYEAGDIVKITHKRGKGGATAFDFRVDRIGEDDYGYIDAKDLRKATDEEVAQTVNDAIFTQAGRKPNEYRKGDIVRITEFQCGHAKGSVVEVVSDGNEYSIEVKGDSKHGFTSYGADISCVEPVAFVENRIN